MVRDFQPMKRRMQDLADDYLRAATSEGGERSHNLRETEGMVRWLCEENYVLLPSRSTTSPAAASGAGHGLGRQP